MTSWDGINAPVLNCTLLAGSSGQQPVLSLPAAAGVQATADAGPAADAASAVVQSSRLLSLALLDLSTKVDLFGVAIAPLIGEYATGGPDSNAGALLRHSLEAAAPVAAEAAKDRGTLGTMVAGNDNLDYAVIQFDPAKVTPVANFGGFAINGIGPDPAFGQIACKQGRTTGNSCGVTWGPGQDPGTIVMQVCGQPGDSGGPVTVNNLLVGMIHGAFSEKLPVCIIKYIPLHTPAVVQSINAILADINAKNRPGAGFVPVPA